MNSLNRLMINLCTEHLVQTQAFYTTLFAMEVAFESDWFVHLRAANQSLELGIIAADHAIVPAGAAGLPQGFYLTFVVEDVAAVYQLAQQANYPILQEPHDTFYGQRRLVLQDPNGIRVDVSAPLAPPPA